MNLREEIELYIQANPKYSKELVDKFIAYWEKEVKGKPRWLNEKLFKLPQRLAQWKKNEVRFANKKKIQRFRNLLNNINPLR